MITTTGVTQGYNNNNSKVSEISLYSRFCSELDMQNGTGNTCQVWYQYKRKTRQYGRAPSEGVIKQKHGCKLSIIFFPIFEKW